MGIIHFHNNTSIHKQKYILIFERFLKNENISFFEFLNSLNLNENTYTYINFEKKFNNAGHFSKT